MFRWDGPLDNTTAILLETICHITLALAQNWSFTFARRIFEHSCLGAQRWISRWIWSLFHGCKALDTLKGPLCLTLYVWTAHFFDKGSLVIIILVLGLSENAHAGLVVMRFEAIPESIKIIPLEVLKAVIRRSQCQSHCFLMIALGFLLLPDIKCAMLDLLINVFDTYLFMGTHTTNDAQILVLLSTLPILLLILQLLFRIHHLFLIILPSQIWQIAPILILNTWMPLLILVINSLNFHKPKSRSPGSNIPEARSRHLGTIILHCILHFSALNRAVIRYNWTRWYQWSVQQYR